MRRRIGFILVTVALSLLAASAVHAADDAGFSDVPSDHPFCTEIEELVDLGIIHGHLDGTFRPDIPVIRQQMAKILVLAFGSHTEAVDNANEPTFGDVTPDMGVPYPFDYVEEAAAAGYFIGDAAGLFRPGANITRAQLALVLLRAGGDDLVDPPAGYDPGFTDVPEFAAEEVAKAKYNGILDGKTPTTFDPYAEATRGQVARMVSRLLAVEPTPPANLVNLHLDSGSVANTQCIACHGDKANEVSLDPAIPSVHALHLNADVLAFAEMEKGCGVCHVSTDIREGSGGSIGTQVDPLFCLSCHGTFAKSRHGGSDWAATNPTGCSMCHGAGSALDPAGTHEATPYVNVPPGQGCSSCHGGLALFAAEETN
ncbi:MAG: S-layer homology domain-containing protein [Thermoleophilia bacterium]|nr:S-layer homology domain-containing protein [Thermoleophilia bacterium]